MCIRDSLCAEEGKDARARRDAGGIGLKTVLAEMPAAHANAGAVVKTLVPKLVAMYRKSEARARRRARDSAEQRGDARSARGRERWVSVARSIDPRRRTISRLFLTTTGASIGRRDLASRSGRRRPAARGRTFIVGGHLVQDGREGGGLRHGGVGVDQARAVRGKRARRVSKSRRATESSLQARETAGVRSETR